MSQPKLDSDLSAQLAYFGLKVHCYQPVSHFKKTPPRPLPNVPRDDDPWEVFLRKSSGIGIVLAVAYGATLREAVESAIHMRPGLSGALMRLAEAVDDLTETIQCR